jgi:zinc protease
VLSNGLEFVIKPSHLSNVVSIQLWIKVGSIHEQDGEYGIAHFLEHMIFKGTEQYKSGEIAKVIEECGGDFNAYTSFEHTVIYLTVCADFADVGLNILAEIFQRSRLDPNDFEIEKEVILEEINKCLDNPGNIIGQKVFEKAFHSTPLARPIFGSKESVSNLRIDKVKNFYQTWYRPDNAFLVVVGDIDAPSISGFINEKFNFSNSLFKRNLSLGLVKDLSFQRSLDFNVIKGDFKTPRLELVFPAPPLGHFDCVCLDLAASVLGAGEMSRFNRRIRDKSGSVQSISVSLFSPSFEGLFEISAILHEEQIFGAIRDILRELALIRGAEPVTESEISRIRANLRAEHHAQIETVDGQARILGNGMLTNHKMLFDMVYSTLLENIPISSITSAIKNWISTDTMKVVVLVNNKSLLNEEQLRKWVREILEEKAIPDTFKYKVPQPLKTAAEPSEIILENHGLKVIYKQNRQSELFTLTAATEGGLRAEKDYEYGVFNGISQMLGSSHLTKSYEMLVNEIESNGASLEGFSGRDSLGINLQCMSGQTRWIIGNFQECLVNPQFEDDLWQIRQREILQAIEAHDDSAPGICMRRLQEEVYGSHPYSQSILGNVEAVKKFNAQTLHQKFLSYRDKGPWVFAAIGPQSPKEFSESIKDIVDVFKCLKQRRQFFASKNFENQDRFKQVIVTKDREQTQIAIGFSGLPWDDPDRFALDILINILGGSSGRLFRTLREERGLVYNVSPILSYGRERGLVGAYAAAAPSKAKIAMELLREQIFDMCERKPSDSELKRAKSYIVSTHEMAYQRANVRVSSMALMEVYGLGFDDFLQYAKKIQLVSCEDIQRLASRLFEGKWFAEVFVGRNEFEKNI